MLAPFHSDDGGTGHDHLHETLDEPASLACDDDLTEHLTAGFGDTISFGATDWLRDQWNINGGIDKSSAFYTTGVVAGVVESIALGFAAGGEDKGGCDPHS